MGERRLEFRGVHKTFKVRDRSDALRDAIPRLAARLLGRGATARPVFVALDGISFSVDAGEALGIIGTNGSGKSTTLRLAAGIYRPDNGLVAVEGRASALIELAAGFHPDLSGRENIVLGGVLLGLRRQEIEDVFDRIVEFADIGDFLDSPVRTYSWGMTVRLGFAVAASIPAGVLLVDEVLAVGDMSFRAKCLRRMSERRSEGAAILFVSHNLTMIEQFCDRVLLLDQGRVLADDTPRRVIDEYRRRVLASDNRRRIGAASGQVRRGTGEAVLVDVVLQSDRSLPVATAAPGCTLCVSLEWKAERPIAEPIFGVSFHSIEGLILAEVRSEYDGESPPKVTTRGRATLAIADLPLLPGDYEVSAYILDATGLVTLDHHQTLYPLRILGERRAASGYVKFTSRWTLEQ